MPAFDRETVQKFKEGQAGVADLFGLDAKQVAALLITGHTLWQQGHLDKARDLFAGLALLDPANPYLHAMLGSIDQKQQKYESAIQQYTWALQLFPQDMDSLTNRAECYLHLGKFQQASEDLKQCIALDPSQKNAAANRARILLASTHASLKLVKEKGPDALAEMKQAIDRQRGAGA